jgi:hypothetical protein
MTTTSPPSRPRTVIAAGLRSPQARAGGAFARERTPRTWAPPWRAS